jgi:hypothetical protein
MVTIFHGLAIALNFFVFFSLLLFLKKMEIHKEDIYIIVFFFFPFYFSFASCLFSMIVLGKSFLEYYPSTFGRMMNITLYLGIFLCIIHRKNTHTITTKEVLSSYLFGSYILLFFGIWQILNVVFNVPVPDFNTRDLFYFENGSAAAFFTKKRITSIAREPAYLVPYLIDAFIILFYTSNRFILMVLFLILLYFSFSLSGYINIIFVVLLIFCFKKKNAFSNKLFVTIIFLLCCICGYMLRDSILIVLRRLNPDILLNSGRLQEIILPLKYMFSTAVSLYNFVFGFGPKGYIYIASFIPYRRGSLLSSAVTSHVIFVDLFIEHGIIGLVVIVLLFIYLLKIATKIYKKNSNMLGLMLCIHLFITSLYTSDYASPRFIIFVMFILFLYKDSLVCDKKK